jgi:hypothetical protein
MTSTEQITPKGSGVDVYDFSHYCEDDIEPTLNKKILYLIDSDVDYIVYVANDLFAQWSLTKNYGKTISAFATISNRVNQLETLSMTSLRKYQRKALARMLAGALARIIGDKDEEKAQEVLATAESYYFTRSSENARAWYLGGASFIAFLTFIIACYLWIQKSRAISFFGDNAFEVALGTLLGGIGALFFILRRTDDIQMDATAGPSIHYIESISRVLAGNIGALIVALAIKANFIIGFTQGSGYSLPLLLLLCTCAGTSERFVSGMIKRIETSGSMINEHVKQEKISRKEAKEILKSLKVSGSIGTVGSHKADIKTSIPDNAEIAGR